MNDIYADTAILLFSIAPAEEAHAKKIVSNRVGNLNSITYLNSQSLRKLKQTKIPFFTFQKQQGKQFGERLAHAIQGVFDQGYNKVITIGNDCLDLSAKDLVETVQLLDTHSSVLGPDQRNGAYLIGLDKESWDFDLFAKLRWQSKHTFSDLQTFLDQPVLLNQKKDINHSAEFIEFIKQASRGLRKRIWSIISTEILFFKKNTPLFSFVEVPEEQLRGPPSAFVSF